MKVKYFTKLRKIISLLFLSFTFTSVFADDYLFIENKGQWPNGILFKSGIPGGEIIIHKNGIYYQFYDTKQLDNLHFTNYSKEGRKNSSTIATQTVLLKFKNANPIQTIEKYTPSETYYNFFIGNNPSEWKSNVNGFKELIIRDLYKNIDFRIYEINHSLKYEYIVKPHGNPSEIKQEYQGVEDIQFENNNLILKLPFTVFKELAPFTYQKSGARSKVIETQFAVNQNTVSFLIGDYDKTQPLVIDPELIFSTYSGASSDNWSHTATNDLNGNLYAGGSVFGSGYPITSGVFQPTGSGTASSLDLITDIVISKYSADGKKLLYSTFLGGSSSEVPHSMIVNSKNELVIYGTTSSANFPITASAYSKHFAGGSNLNGEPITTSIVFSDGTDCFVSVISENGNKLVGSTLIGGSGNDGIHDSRYTPIRNYGDEFRSEVVIDNTDNIYVGTVSNSDDFPIVGGKQKKSSSHDGIIFKISPNCSTLLWSTYIGGKSYDAVNAIRVNNKNEIYVTGVTVSSDFSYGDVYSSDLKGDSDGFIAKFSNGTLAAASYIGTSKGDVCLFIDFDKNENIYVMGLTLGTYPVTSGVYRIEKSSQFIHCLDKNLKNTVFSTVYGSGRGEGTIDVVPTAFMVNDCGNIYISAWGGKVNVTTSLNLLSSTKNLPITNDAFQKTTTGSNYHFLILEANAKSLLFGTYFGSSAPNNPDNERGDHLDGGTCRFDKKGIIYHSACVCKGSDGLVNFPMKNSVTTQHNSSNCNMAAFKFDIGSLAADFKLLNTNNIEVTNACNPAQILLKNASKNALSYQWFVDNELVSRFENPTYEFKKSGKHQIKLVAYNTKLCISADSIEKQIFIKDFPTKVSVDTSVCAGKPLQLFASGGTSYLWSPSAGISDITSSHPTIIPSQTTDYVVTISDSVCSVKRTIKIKILDEKTDFQLTNSKEICNGDTIKLEAKGDFYKIEWRNGTALDSSKFIIVNPSKTTTYQATAFYRDGCTPQKSVTVSIDEAFLPNFDYKLNYDCKTSPYLSFTNLNVKNVEYEWSLGNTKLKSLSAENITFDESGNYKIKLKATNAIGCILEKEINLNYTAFDGVIPNVITPNNDGINDTFSIGFPVEKLSVYSRWGKLIYSSAEYQNDWGKSVSNGTYFYEVTLKNGYVCKGYLDVMN